MHPQASGAYHAWSNKHGDRGVLDEIAARERCPVRPSVHATQRCKGCTRRVLRCTSAFASLAMLRREPAARFIRCSLDVDQRLHLLGRWSLNDAELTVCLQDDRGNLIAFVNAAEP